MYIKAFNRFMINNTKNKDKNTAEKRLSKQCFSRKKILNKHKKDCLVINGKQNVKLEKGFIRFTNYSRQILVPFKIYADFECQSYTWII